MKTSDAIERPREGERDETRERILDDFRARYPDLAEAMGLAGEAESAWRAFERGQRPAVSFSVSSTTQLR